jgi:hypothetical protein
MARMPASSWLGPASSMPVSPRSPQQLSRGRAIHASLPTPPGRSDVKSSSGPNLYGEDARQSLARPWLQHPSILAADAPGTGAPLGGSQRRPSPALHVPRLLGIGEQRRALYRCGLESMDYEFRTISFRELRTILILKRGVECGHEWNRGWATG